MNDLNNEQDVNEANDLMSRLSQGSGEANKSQTNESSSNEQSGGDFLTRIKSAKTAEDAAKLAEEALKSFESGYTKKFQTLAEERKALESMKNKYSSWDKDRVMEVLNDPKFNDIVNEINSFEDEDEEEHLTEAEKRLKRENEEIKKKIAEIDAEKQNALVAEKHSSLSKKYADYNKDDVYSFMQEVSSGKKVVGFEDVYKLINYERKIQQAYELGKKDSGVSAANKFNASSDAGGVNGISGDKWVPDPSLKSEKNTENFFRLALMKAKERINK